VVARYGQVFGANPGFQVPVERPDCVSAWHLYVLRLRPEVLGVDRNTFIDRLKALNIGTSVHYRPLHMMSFYATKYGFRPEDFPVAMDAYRRMVSLPLHPRLSDEDVQDVIDAVHEAVGSPVAA
jgi:dTDP-4-amino-4,6-dideoxygalactose transaminase